jgi:hypothetical protein
MSDYLSLSFQISTCLSQERFKLNISKAELTFSYSSVYPSLVKKKKNVLTHQNLKADVWHWLNHLSYPLYQFTTKGAWGICHLNVSPFHSVLTVFTFIHATIVLGITVPVSFLFSVVPLCLPIQSVLPDYIQHTLLKNMQI